MTRKITPHKGGRTADIHFRVTPETKRRLGLLAARDRISVADWIHNQVEDEMKPYLLTIYTWPPMTGFPCEAKTTKHKTAAEVSAYLKQYNSTFYSANLQLACPGGYEPCDFDGNRIGQHVPWPQILGSNNLHPEHERFLEQKHEIIENIRQRYVSGGPGMIAIAEELLEARGFHNTAGIATMLGEMAAGLRDENSY